MTLVEFNPAATGRRMHWELRDLAMLRVTGLPIETTERLRTKASRDWADALLAAETLTGELREEASAALHRLIGGNDDHDNRQRLLAMRRQLFKGRVPGDPDDAVAFIRGLDPGAGEAYRKWLVSQREWNRHHETGESIVAADWERAIAELRRVSDDETLRQGLLMASPLLEHGLDAFIAGRAVPSKKERRTVRSLLSYIYRAAGKPSPFSTLTGIARSAFTGGGAAVHEPVEVGGWRSNARISVVVVNRLTAMITEDPERLRDVPVALATDLVLDEDRVRYVRRWVTAGDDSIATTFDAATTSLYFLQRTGALERLVVFLRDRPGLRLGAIVDWLAAETRSSAADATRYLEALLRLGIISAPFMQVDVHSANPLRTLREHLRAFDRPWATAIAEALDRPLATVAAYPDATAAERRELLRRLRTDLEAVQAMLGHEGATLPQTIVYEDVSADGPAPRLDRQAWEGLLREPLIDLERVLPAFDITLLQRLTLTGFFAARYGRDGECHDLAGFIHDFHEDLFDQYQMSGERRVHVDEDGTYLREENWLNLDGVRKVDDARFAVIEQMRSRYDVSRPGDEIVLDRDFVEAVAAPLDGVDPAPALHSYFFQPAHHDEDPLMVLNQVYGGFAFPFSRFAHCYGPDASGGDLAVAIRDEARRSQPAGAVFAELTGGAVTTNLNLHPRMLDYQIVCPGERASVPGDAQLTFDDLYLRHEAGQNRLTLRSRRLGREVIPVYLGYLMPLALPETARTLLLLASTTMARLSLWTGVAEPPAVDGVVVRPRVRYGPVVLSRHSWTVTADRLPRYGAIPAGDWFLTWQRWRRQHGLPARAFVKVAKDAERGRPGKPQYVDFDSQLSLFLLDGMLTPDAELTFTEMLPDEQHTPVRSERGGHLAELAIETISRYEEGA